MTKKEIMREAHRRARTYEGDYSACLALALREIYRELKSDKSNKRTDKNTQIIDNALKRVIAGRARNKDGYSPLDNINSMSFLWRDGYKYDFDEEGHEGLLISSLNGDIYNSCYEEGLKILQTKKFNHIGQAVNYLAKRFQRMVYLQYSRFIEGKTTKAMKMESSLYEEDTYNYVTNNIVSLDEYSFLDTEMAQAFSGAVSQRQCAELLLQGYTEAEIVKAGVAAKRTVQKAKSKLKDLVEVV